MTLGQRCREEGSQARLQDFHHRRCSSRIVLIIGLTLVYLSFERITAVTNSAASQFIGKVAELSADRIGSQLRLVRDNLEILNALPPIQSGGDRGQSAAECAACGHGEEQRPALQPVCRLRRWLVHRDGRYRRYWTGLAREAGGARTRRVPAGRDLEVRSAPIKSRRIFLSDKLETVRELPGPLDYDPRERPWYKDAERRDGSWLTGPYVFFATAKQGYTVQLALKQGRGGVIAGDMLMDATQEVLKREKLTASGVAFLFDDDDRILAHPRMSELLGREVSGHHSSPARDRYGRRSQGDPCFARKRDFRTVLCRSGGPAVCRGISEDPRRRSVQSARRRRGAGR